MSAYQFLRKLFPFSVWATLIFSLSTFIAYFSEWSFLGLDFIWYRFDLRREYNVATWFSSIAMAYCGLTFLLIGWEERMEFSSRFSRLFFITIGLFSFFLSADEAAQLHEALGKALSSRAAILDDTIFSSLGFAWILIFAPLIIIAGIWAFRALKDLGKTAALAEKRKKIALLYLAAFFSIAAGIILNVFEGVVFTNQQDHTLFLLFLLPCFEETFELLVMVFFSCANLEVIQESFSCKNLL
jgi:hypothetical protein